MIYFVECFFGPSIGTAFCEAERRLTRQDIILRIAEGQYEEIRTILAVDPIAGTCDDVTNDLLDEAREVRLR